MSEPAGRKEQDVADRRHLDRSAFGGDVTVRFGDLEVVGPGQNISDTGIYFVTEARAWVRVLVDGEVRDAELVRVESQGKGRLGVAVRFIDEPQD